MDWEECVEYIGRAVQVGKVSWVCVAWIGEDAWGVVLCGLGKACWGDMGYTGQGGCMGYARGAVRSKHERNKHRDICEYQNSVNGGARGCLYRPLQETSIMKTFSRYLQKNFCSA